MPVVVHLEAVLASRKLKAKVVAQRVGISETQFSLFRSGKIKGIRFSTLSRLCAVLECELSDVMSYRFDREDLRVENSDLPSE